MQRMTAQIAFLLLVSLFPLVLCGCGTINVGGAGGGKKEEAQPPVLVYTFNTKGKKVESGVIAKNMKIPIIVTDRETGKKYNVDIDAGGWQVIAPSSNVPASEVDQNGQLQ